MMNDAYQDPMVTVAIYLAIATTTAKIFHRGQVRWDGSDYFDNHIQQVTEDVCVKHSGHVDGPTLAAIALLHDIIEDTACDEEMLRSLGFDDRVMDGVLAITKVYDGSEDYWQYLERVKRNPDARAAPSRSVTSAITLLTLWKTIRTRQNQSRNTTKRWIS